MNVKQALVTGGAGFIGSHLVEALVATGVQVRVLDDFSSGRRDNLAGLAVEVVEGDVAKMDVATTAVAGCDLVFHLAALVSVPRSLREPVLNQRSNVTGAFNVFEAARQAGVRRVVYSSSAAVYGNLPNLPKREESPLQLLTPYAAAKRMNELLAATYRQAYGLESVGLRYMNVYGPRQDPSSPYSGVLSIFCEAAVAGRGVTIFGDGQQTRDFVYVADVVAANLLAAEADISRLPSAPVFNIGRGRQTSLKEIATVLGALSAGDLPVTYEAARDGDIRHSYADISRARDVLGFAPQVELQDGLAQTLDWFSRG